MNCENSISLLLNFQIFFLKIFLFKETIFDFSVFPITFRLGILFLPCFINLFPNMTKVLTSAQPKIRSDGQSD